MTVYDTNHVGNSTWFLKTIRGLNNLFKIKATIETIMHILNPYAGSNKYKIFLLVHKRSGRKQMKMYCRTLFYDIYRFQKQYLFLEK